MRKEGEILRGELDELQGMLASLQGGLHDVRKTEIFSESSGSSTCQQLMESLENLSCHSERITERFRNLIFGSCLWREQLVRYEDALCRIHGITVREYGGILWVDIPGMIPHRKNAHTDYLYKPLLLALRSWCRDRLGSGEELPFYEEAALCFLHLYDESLPAGRIRDHDNVEEKQAADALGMFFFNSDRGDCLDVFHTSAAGSRDRTYLFLMEKGRFPVWLMEKGWKQMVSK